MGGGSWSSGVQISELGSPTSEPGTPTSEPGSRTGPLVARHHLFREGRPPHRPTLDFLPGGRRCWRQSRNIDFPVLIKTLMGAADLEGCGPSQPRNPLWALFAGKYPFRPAESLTHHPATTKPSRPKSMLRDGLCWRQSRNTVPAKIIVTEKANSANAER